MFAGLWKQAKGFAHKLGLGKHVHNFSNFVNKARHAVGHGMEILKSAPVRNLVGHIAEHAPTVGSYYNDAKKYGSIVSNLMNGGFEKKIDRFIKQPPSIERVRQTNSQSDAGTQEPRKGYNNPYGSSYSLASSLFD